MTGTQLLVLALLGGAFAGGWFARGATDDADEAPSRPVPGGTLGEAREALDGALAALSAVRGMIGVDGAMAAELRADAAERFARQTAALGELEHGLADSLGRDHPSVAEYRRARETLELLAADAGDPDATVFAALADAAADARRRYAVGAQAIEALR